MNNEPISSEYRPLTDDQRTTLSIAAVAASPEMRRILDIIEYLTDEKIIPFDERKTR